MRRLIFPTVSFLAITALCGVASADVVGPPDSIDCPDGSSQQSCHGSEYCAPDRCSVDDDCGDGATCEELDLCMDTRTCGGWSTDLYDEVEGSCGGDGVCSEGSCQAVMVCLASPIFRNAGGGCGCSRAPRPASRPALVASLAVIALVGVVLLHLRRR